MTCEMKKVSKDLQENYLDNWRYIIAIKPFLQENGYNGTVVYYLDGHKEYYNNRCKFVLERLADIFHTTPEKAKERAIGMFGHGAKRKPPLVFSKGFCLVQLKCRDVNRKNDSTLCYVVLQYIKNVEDGSKGSSLILFHKKAPSMEVRQLKKSVCRQIRMARAVQEQIDLEQRYQDNNNRIAAKRLSADDWSPQMSKEELQQLLEAEDEE